MEDKCPFCGAKRIGEPPELSDYACQFDSSGDFTRSMACKDRQIADLQKRLEAWRKLYNNFPADMRAEIYSWDEYKAIQDLEEI